MRQAGFTLIELVVVIVLLAILSAVAIEQFIDLGPCARCAVAEGTCGAIPAQAALLYGSTNAPNSYASIASSLSTMNVSVAASSCSNFSATPAGGSSSISCGINLPSGLCQ